MTKEKFLNQTYKLATPEDTFFFILDLTFFLSAIIIP